MRPFARILLLVAMVAGGCSSAVDEGGPAGSSSAADQPSATPIPEAGAAASAEVRIEGDPLAQAPVRHIEGDAVVGDTAPSLRTPDIQIPADRPTLLLTVVGSCADCGAAAASLGSLAEELGAQAVVVTSDAPGDPLPEPWQLVVDDDAARAFSGRDRPTALVVGSDGIVRSRIRPFNQSGTTYDMVDLRFGLEVAANALVDNRSDDRPATDTTDATPGSPPERFVAVTQGGLGVEVDVASGEIVRQLILEPGDPHEVIPIPGGEFFLVLTCCAPDAEAYVLDGTQPAGSVARIRFGAWEAAVDGAGDRVALTAAERRVEALTGQVADQLPVTIRLGGSNGSSPAVEWLRDGSGVVFLHRGNSAGVVEVVRFDGAGEPVARESFEVDGPGVDLAVDAAGNVVVAVSRFGSSETEALTYDSRTQGLRSRAPLPDGTVHIDTDASGHFLLSVDAEGIAHWSGPAGSGELGGGYRSANW